MGPLGICEEKARRSAKSGTALVEACLVRRHLLNRILLILEDSMAVLYSLRLVCKLIAQKHRQERTLVAQLRCAMIRYV